MTKDLCFCVLHLDLELENCLDFTLFIFLVVWVHMNKLGKGSLLVCLEATNGEFFGFLLVQHMGITASGRKLIVWLFCLQYKLLWK